VVLVELLDLFTGLNKSCCTFQFQQYYAEGLFGGERNVSKCLQLLPEFGNLTLAGLKEVRLPGSLVAKGAEEVNVRSVHNVPT
jgi:hypothetical protein